MLISSLKKINVGNVFVSDKVKTILAVLVNANVYSIYKQNIRNFYNATVPRS